MKPNLFVVGAPKCGTTALATWLAAHPQAFMSAKKEPHFYYSPYGPPMDRATYRDLFAGANNAQVVGEASVWYLFSQTAHRLILRDCPDARFVVCVRDPVDMAVSLHNQKIDTGHERELSFQRAWQLSDERLRGNSTSIFGLPRGDTRHMAYRHACSIGTQLETLLADVGEGRVHVVAQSRLAHDPGREWSRLQQFLELEEDGRTEFPRTNPSMKVRSARLNRVLYGVGTLKRRLGIRKSFGSLQWLHRRNKHAQRYEKPSADVLERVAAELESERAKLEGLLGHSLTTPREFTHDERRANDGRSSAR